MYNFFISHASEDAREAASICQRLESLGTRCWIAPRNIPAGTPYPEAIIDGLNQSSGLILLLSNCSNVSKFVHLEVERAVSKKKMIFLVRIEDIKPSKGLEFFLSSIQWVDRWSPNFDARLTEIAKTPIHEEMADSGHQVIGRDYAYSSIQSRLKIEQGEITKVAVDAITVPSDESMMGNDGLKGIVHLLAGPKLRQFCRELGGGPVGVAKISPGFDLPAKHIIHTVIPRWTDDGKVSKEELALCFRSVFSVAREHNISTLAIPLMGSGSHGFPIDVAAQIAVQECLAGLADASSIDKLLLMSKTDATFWSLQKVAKEHGFV